MASRCIAGATASCAACTGQAKENPRSGGSSRLLLESCNQCILVGYALLLADVSLVAADTGAWIPPGNRGIAGIGSAIA